MCHLVWESEQAYKDGYEASSKSEAAQLIQSMVDTSNPALKPYHNCVTFNQPFEKVASAPVTSMVAVFLPSDADTAAFTAAWEAIASGLASAVPDGFVAGAHGWAADEIEGHPKMDGKKAKVFVTATGWESIEKEKAASAGLAEKFAELKKFSEIHDMVSGVESRLVRRVCGRAYAGVIC
jgi:hypothetical protein